MLINLEDWSFNFEFLVLIELVVDIIWFCGVMEGVDVCVFINCLRWLCWFGIMVVCEYNG